MFRASKVLESAFQEQPRSFFWQGLTENYQVDEAAYLKELIPLAQSDASEHKAITDTASSLIGKVRAQDGSVHMIDALLQEYSLETRCRNCRNTTRWRTVAFLGLWIFLASSAVIPAAFSCASAPGTFRWLFTPARLWRPW